VAKGDFTYKVSAEADLGNLQGEVAKINAALAAARGSVSAFKAEFERDAKGEAEYRIVVSSQYDASGSKVAKAEVKELSKEYQELYNKIKQVESEPQRGSLTSLRQQVNEAKKARDAIAKYGAAIDGIGNKIQKLDGAWVSQNQKVRDLQKQLDAAGASNFWERLSAEYNIGGFAKAGQQISNFVNVFQSVSIIAGQVTGAINNVVNALGDLQTFSLAFEAVGAGAGAANLALAESTRISSGLGTDLKTVREAFQQLSPVILKSGGSIADVSGVVETLSSRFAAYGISGDRARRVTNGVIQAFAKGKLMAEELTQQISEADPAFKTDLAGALKVTVAGLEELVKAGEVTSDVFLKGLLEIGKSDLLFGRLGTSAIDAANSLATAGTTVDQVRAKLGTIGQLSLERFAKSVEPVVFSFIQLGAVVTDAFDRISRLQGIDSLGSIVGDLAGAFVRITDAVLRFAEAGLAVLGVVAKFINVLTSIPGVTDIIALAIASKLIAPLAGLKAAFGSSISAATNFGKTIRAVTTFSGLSEVIKGIGQQSISTAVQVQKLGDQKEALSKKALKAETAIGRLEQRVTAYKKLQGQAALNAPAIGNAQAQAQITSYQKKIDQSRVGLEKWRNSLLAISSDQYTATASLNALANQKGLASKASGVLAGAFRGAAAAGKGLIGTLGPLGVILAAIAVATSAYRNANESSNSILEQSKGRIDALNQATKALGGNLAQQEKPITGLSLVWEKFSFLISDVADSLGRVFSGLGPSAERATEGVGGVVSAIGSFIAAAGAGALAGAALFGWTGIGAIPAALIGAVTASIIALSTASGDAAVKQRQLIKDTDAAKTAVIQQAAAADALISSLEPLGNASVNVNFSKTLAGFRQAETALALLKKDVDALNNQKINLKANAAELKKPSEALTAGFAKVEAQLQKVDALKAKIVEVGGWRKASSELQNMTKEAARLAGEMRIDFRRKFGKEAEEQARKYGELQSAIKIVNDRLYESEAAYKAAQEKSDAYAKANGLLTSEQKETADTTAGLSQKLQELEGALQNDLNPKITPAKWKEASAAIADTTVRLDALNDATTDSVSNELVYTIKAKIDSGEIPNSVANVQRLVQALEARATVLNISSPALVDVIRDLEAARSAADELNGKQAKIRITVLEGRGANSTVATLNEIGRYVDALEQRKVNLSIGSTEISGVIEAQNQAKLLQDAGSKSSGELRKSIQQEYFNRELQEIQRAQSANQQASQERQQALQQELTGVKTIADARIRSLQRLGPAETALANLRRKELEKQATSGRSEMDRLSARAQLERLNKEKEIARIQEQAAEKEREIQAKLRAEQQASQAADKAFRERQLQIQEEMLKIAQEESNEKILASKAVLDAREASSGLADGLASGATSSGTIQKSLEGARDAAGAIANTLTSLDGKRITVNVNYVGQTGLWTGGPTVGGQTYRINELGKEGFLSSTGDLSPINKPRNALWKAPGKGMVIPAHIMSNLNVPTGRVSTGVRPAVTGSGSNGLTKIARAIHTALSQTNKPDSGVQEMAAVQAHQAIQIGKLSRAVTKLADKDWNVNVGVRNTGSTAYLDALNRRM